MCYESKKQCKKILDEIAAMKASMAVSDENQAKKLDAFTSSPSTDLDFNKLYQVFSVLLGNLQDTDMAPTATTVTAVKQYQREMKALLSKWDVFKSQK